MTTLYQKKKQCAVCGAEQEYTEIRSSIAFGSPDLDMRPPEMQRSTISAWVQRCLKCGYCASDISKAPDQAASAVRSATYREQLADSTLPESANRFLCKAIVDESAGDYASAAWALIHAAWVCDDAEEHESARKCRNKTADMVVKAIETAQEFVEQAGAETAILTDLLRRAGRFSEAKQIIASKRSDIREDIILKVLAFQELLIARGDTACHTIAEAIGEEE